MSAFQVGDVVMCVDDKHTDTTLTAGLRYSLLGVDVPPGFVMVDAVAHSWFVADRFKLVRRNIVVRGGAGAAAPTHGKPLPDIKRTPVADAIATLTGSPMVPAAETTTINVTGLDGVTRSATIPGRYFGPSRLASAQRKVIDTAVSAAKDGQWWKVNQAVRHLEWLEGKN